MATNWKELHNLAVAERKMLGARISDALRYSQRLDQLELSPNGDDFNALVEIIGGGGFREPHTANR